MADWDADDFEPQDVERQPVATDKWEGEDEEEEIKDNWDDEEQEANKEPTKAIQVKKKKPLKERIAEREAKQKAEEEALRKAAEEARRKRTPEEIAQEKMKQKKLQEDADLQLAKEAFGISNEVGGGEGIDAFNPTTKEEFDTFCDLIQDKITKYESSPYYVGFLEVLYRNLAVSLEADDVKKLGSTLSALSNEKVKAQKSAKGKKKGSKKATVVVGKDNNYDDYVTGDYDEYGDFI